MFPFLCKPWAKVSVITLGSGKRCGSQFGSVGAEWPRENYLGHKMRGKLTFREALTEHVAASGRGLGLRALPTT